jgi:hypothetical protein
LALSTAKTAAAIASPVLRGDDFSPDRTHNSIDQGKARRTGFLRTDFSFFARIEVSTGLSYLFPDREQAISGTDPVSD